MPSQVVRNNPNELLIFFNSFGGFWKIDKSNDKTLKKVEDKTDWYCTLDYISIHRGAKYLTGTTARQPPIGIEIKL